jgi:hypothetical protein
MTFWFNVFKDLQFEFQAKLKVWQDNMPKKDHSLSHHIPIWEFYQKMGEWPNLFQERFSESSSGALWFISRVSRTSSQPLIPQSTQKLLIWAFALALSITFRKNYFYSLKSDDQMDIFHHFIQENKTCPTFNTSIRYLER